MAAADSLYGPTERLPGGFFQFCDEVVEPMLAERCGLMLHYAMVSPVESPHDTPQMNLIRRGEAEPWTAVGELYLGQLDRIRHLGAFTSRLLVVPGTRENLSADDLDLMQAMYRRAHEEGEEEFRFASFAEQVAPLWAACGDDSPLADAYVGGIRQGSPDGGYWGVYPTPTSRTPLVVAEVVYEQGHFSGFDIYRREATRAGQQPISADREAYVGFWRGVHLDPAQSTAVQAA